VNFQRQVFCGLPFGLLPPSGTHSMATFSGLSQHMTTQSHPPCFHYFGPRFHPDLLNTSSLLMWSLRDILSIFRIHRRWKTSKVLRIALSIAMSRRREALSITRPKCRSGTWQCYWSSVRTESLENWGCFAQSRTYIRFRINFIGNILAHVLKFRNALQRLLSYMDLWSWCGTIADNYFVFSEYVISNHTLALTIIVISSKF